MYSSIFTRKNGTNPTKFRPRTSSTLAFVGGKKTQFLGFFRHIAYTKMFLLTRLAGLPKRGRQIKVDKSWNFGFESNFFHLRYTKRQYCVWKNTISSSKLGLVFCSICLYFSCRGDWWFVELRNFWFAVLDRARFLSLKNLGSFSSDSPSQLDILWHDGHTFGVNGAQVGVLEKSD